jgi:quinol monooxygenase YgiN
MLTSGYYVTAEIRVKDPSRVDETKAALAALARDTLFEPGCTIFTVHQDAAQPTRFVLWERFDDEQAFKAHGALPHTKAFGALGLVEMVQAIRTNVLEG